MFYNILSILFFFRKFANMKIKQIIKQEKRIKEFWLNELAELWDVFPEDLDGDIFQFSDLYLNLEDVRLCVINKVPFSMYCDYQDGIIDGKKQRFELYIKYGWISTES